MRMDGLFTLKAAEYPSDMMTVVIGLVVVFGVLLLLTLIFWLFGKIAGGNGTQNVQKPAVPTVSPASAPAAPIVHNDEVSDEVVAVIAAAIAAMSTDGKQYTIRRIRPVALHGLRSVWAAAGVAENTRPF